MFTYFTILLWLYVDPLVVVAANQYSLLSIATPAVSNSVTEVGYELPCVYSAFTYAAAKFVNAVTAFVYPVLPVNVNPLPLVSFTTSAVVNFIVVPSFEIILHKFVADGSNV